MITRIFGLDFTSAPTPKKQMTLIECAFDGNVLRYVEKKSLNDYFSEFEAFLEKPGPWVAGFDFPIGQPQKLIEKLNWPMDWAGYVKHVATLGKKDFESKLREYSAEQKPGEKQHKRDADRKAKSLSPMKLDYTPVGKMFFEGATRLNDSQARIMPCRANNDSRIVLEAYPALVARRWIEKRKGYKSDSKPTKDHREQRALIIDGLKSPELWQFYGFKLDLGGASEDEFINDGSADILDSLLCAVQAAWASKQPNYGIPTGHELEGWIVDPCMLKEEPCAS